MKILVLGAGVVGVTTAYRLATLGHDVTVIERRNEAAAEASYANGGQLSYDFASPMASPGIFKHLADYLLGRDEAFRIELALNPAFLHWGARFLFNCLGPITAKNRIVLANLANRSQNSFDRLRDETGIEFCHRNAGKLVLFDNASEFTAACNRMKHNAASNSKLRAVSAAECEKIEPGLLSWRNEIAGGLYASGDEVGDARMFTNALAQICSGRLGVKFLLGKTVCEIHTKNKKLTEVETDDGFYRADKMVVCLGVNAARVLSPIGISAPIWPIYGYSLTAPATLSAPQKAITDLGNKMVYSRIGGNLRVAGFADAGRSYPANPDDRMRRLEEIARATFPDSAEFDQISSRWVGMRPSTPNSLPIVGATKIENLYVNIGHGMFGWTLSAICADIISEQIGSDDNSGVVRSLNAA